MPIIIEQLESCSFLKMTSHLDKQVAPELLLVFDELLKKPNNNVIIDFSETIHIDSSGIGALAYLYKQLHRQGLTLTFVGLKKQPLKKIKVLHINEIIKVTRKIQ